MSDDQHDFLIFGESPTKQYKITPPHPLEASRKKSFDELRQSGESLFHKLDQEFNENLGYNSKTVTWLEEYLSRFRNTFSKQRVNELISAIGYILGQSIIEVYGGEWQYYEAYHQWVVNVGEPVGIANPIGKVQKYLADDLDSLSSFFEAIALVMQKGDWGIGNKSEGSAKR